MKKNEIFHKDSDQDPSATCTYGVRVLHFAWNRIECGNVKCLTELLYKDFISFTSSGL